jgi:hypothetical protein
LLHDAGTLPPPELRCLDAIHLATALRLGEELARFVAYNTRLADAARAVGLTVDSPNRTPRLGRRSPRPRRTGSSRELCRIRDRSHRRTGPAARTEVHDVETLREDIAHVPAPLGLRLSAAKTRVLHMSEGFDLLGFHIQWRRKRGTNKWYLYTFVADRPIRSLKAKIRALTNRTSTTWSRSSAG